MIPAEGSPSHDVPDGTYDGELPFVPPGQFLPGMELQAEDIIQREDLDNAMEQDPAGECPAVAFQVNYCSQIHNAKPILLPDKGVPNMWLHVKSEQTPKLQFMSSCHQRPQPS